MRTNTSYTITYTIQTSKIEVTTLDADFALWLAVEKKQTFESDAITAKELLQHYTASVYELYQQEQAIKKILLL